MQTIEAVRFRPTTASARQRGPIITVRRVLLLAAAVAAGWLLWFLFTAKSVRFELQPSADRLSVDGGFAFGEVYLLRQGSYRIQAQAAGYHDIDEAVQIGADRNQVVALNMVPLPGRVAFDIVPEGATVTIGDGEASGSAPFETKLAAGQHVARISHGRYQPATVRFEVAGRDRPQTVSAALVPNWADVAIVTRPAGAEIRIDGVPSGVATPARYPYWLASAECPSTWPATGHGSTSCTSKPTSRCNCRR